MPQVDAVVSWSTTTNGPIVTPDPIPVPLANGATVIHWTCDNTITNFQISGLDTSVFTQPNSSGNGTVTNCTDRNNSVGTFNYNVTATHAQSGKTAAHDPRIENGGGPMN